MLDTITQEVIVSPEYHGQRVDVVLAQIFPDFSRSQLSQWLKTGAIRINQCTNYKPKDKIKGGECIQLHWTPTQDTWAQAEDIPLTVEYEDDDILIINKPAGLVVHPGSGNREHTLVNALLHHAPSLSQLPRAGIVHRLDKDTTGLLMVAKTLMSHTDLVRQLQARTIQRTYLAVVQGVMTGSGVIETFYGRDPRHRTKMAVRETGKEAITHYRIQQSFPFATLLEVQLKTGRTHQIRVHMAHLRHPLVGDTLYGAKAKLPTGLSPTLREAFLSFPRQALHAQRLALLHPRTGEACAFEAAIPQDLKTLLKTMHDD